MTTHPDNHLYVVEVDDHCAAQLVGHTGCSYASPPQPALQALALVRALLACPQNNLTVADGPWRCAIAGGQRTIRLHPLAPTGSSPSDSR